MLMEKKKEKVTRTADMTYRDILLLPLRIFTRREDDGVPGEVPCEYDLRGCDFVFLRQGYD
jgi:hypothetical protein